MTQKHTYVCKEGGQHKGLQCLASSYITVHPNDMGCMFSSHESFCYCMCEPSRHRCGARNKVYGREELRVHMHTHAQ